jgi:hypothetical protein
MEGAMMVAMLGVMMTREMMRAVALGMTVRKRRLTESDQEKRENESTHTSAPFIISDEPRTRRAVSLRNPAVIGQDHVQKKAMS